jgi:nitrate reductase NapD
MAEVQRPESMLMRDDKTTELRRSRRDFITGRSGGEPAHIASILVQGWPDKLPLVEAELTGLPGVESHGSNGAGKLILTVETGSDAELIGTINRIETSDGVIAVSLVYHHAEEMGDDS